MTTVWMRALLVALTGSLLLVGTAAAQDDATDAIETDLDDSSSSRNDDNRALDWLDEVQTCDAAAGDEVASVLDVTKDASAGFDDTRTSSLDEDEVLLAIALNNNGIDDFDVEDIFDMSRERTERASLSQETDIDRDDVFSAVALGMDGGLSDSDAAACAADIDASATVEEREERSIDLTEDDTLLAIALGNNGSGSISFWDVASSSHSVSTRVTTSHTSDLDREDVLLLLTLG